ncbi:MAG: PepSY domain-containing protein, partial [Planctomycetaceae bacterium]|nr:PepSY domain-containing protein [Planctomycetaceae bacterium]
MFLKIFRRFFYEIHLWLGIISGIAVFLVCLSGTILVFRDEINRLANPGKFYVSVPVGAKKLPIDDIIAKVEAENQGKKITSMTIPEQANRTLIVMLSQPMRSGERREGRPRGGHGFGQIVCVNPYTGETVANGGEGTPNLDRFFMSMLQLHRNLWISYKLESFGPRATFGGLIVGIATIIFVIVVLSGFVLWLPRTWKAFTLWKAWKPGFLIRVRKGFWLFLYDIHNTAGFYMLIPLLIFALTGLCWSFGWYRDAASYLLGDQVFKQRMMRPEKIEPVDKTMQPYSVGEIIERQNKLTPGYGEMIVSIPTDRETALVIQKGRTGFFALSIKDKTQWDRFRGMPIPVEHFGKTAVVERFADKPFGAKIAATIRTLHFGDVT